MYGKGSPDAGVYGELAKIKTAEPEIYPENADAQRLFYDLATQWHWVSGMKGARRTGINYQSAESVMRVRGVALERQGELLDELRIMELAALDTLRTIEQQRINNGK